MFGFTDGTRPELMERAITARLSSERPQLLPTRLRTLKQLTLKAAQALRIDANQQAPHAESGPRSVAELIALYRLKELAGVKMMVPNLGEIKMKNTLKVGGRSLIAPISNPDFGVTLGPYAP
jgi:hypothetical protein